jgi:pimeloyl-ACP methyl ester carboxylesterase
MSSPGSAAAKDSRPTFVLVPGAGGEAWYWHRVVAELTDRGYEAIAVDLPADDDALGIPEYADVVVAAAGAATSVVLVGQSLGGFTATLAATRLPVELLVLLNAMVPAIGEAPGDWWANTDQDTARRANDVREGRDPDGEFDVDTYFLHDVPGEVLATASPPRIQSGAVFAGDWTLPAWPEVPIRVLTGRDDRFFPPDFQRRVAQERLSIPADEIPGGHLAALSHPRELTDRLLSYLTSTQS